MLYSLAAFALLGLIHQRVEPGARQLVLAAAVLVLVMANMRGFYWHIFPRGHGFFTANRVTANLIFALAFYGATRWRAAAP